MAFLLKAAVAALWVRRGMGLRVTLPRSFVSQLLATQCTVCRQNVVLINPHSRQMDKIGRIRQDGARNGAFPCFLKWILPEESTLVIATLNRIYNACKELPLSIGCQLATFRQVTLLPTREKLAKSYAKCQQDARKRRFLALLFA
jgi:hypothetical protein